LCAAHWKVIVVGMVVAFEGVTGCGLRNQSAGLPNGTSEQTVIPTAAGGVTATITSVDGLILTGRPLRLEHTLKNTSGEPVVIHDLENVVLPWFDGEWFCAGGGPSSPRPKIMLSSGQGVSRWVEISRGEPPGNWAFSVSVRSEATGVSYVFCCRKVPRTICFHVGYDDKLFTGDWGDEIAAVLATPWLKIQVGEEADTQQLSPPDSE